MKRRRNLLVWVGFGVVLAGFLSYIPLFISYEPTRDSPWANFLLFALGAALIGVGLKRAYGQPEVYRGKVGGTVLAVLSLLMVALFGAFTVFTAKILPATGSALRAGQTAPLFTLANAEGKPIEEAQLLRSHRAVLLIFYRGYW